MTLAIAHRGASGTAPENTEAAFCRARQLGADGVELDVQLSRDGVPVVIHDETLERTTNGRGAVADTDAATLTALDAGSWFHPDFASVTIPTLESTFEVLGADMHVNVELKPGHRIDELARVVLSLVDRFNRWDRVVFSSFQFAAVLALRRHSPRARIGILVAPGREAFLWSRARRVAAVNVHPAAVKVAADTVAAARRHRLALWTWTANERTEIDRLLALGVDAIMSDHPDRVVEGRDQK